MSRKTQKNTKLADYIIENFRNVSSFVTALNKWARMDIFNCQAGSCELHRYARGERKPYGEKQMLKFKLVCDFIRHTSGDNADLTWIEPYVVKKPKQEEKQIEAELTFADTDNREEELFGEICEAFRPVFSIFYKTLSTR